MPATKINLLELSPDAPLTIGQAEYDELKAMLHNRSGKQSWSYCKDQKEWLVKLHYLRSGVQAGRLSEEQFLTRETQLVLGFLGNSG